MLILNRSAVTAALTMPEAIDAASAALAAYSSGEAVVPLRTHVACRDGVALYMPGLVAEEAALGAKVVSVFPGNPARNLPTITAAMVLQDPVTGVPVALLEASHLTALRTGAAGGLAARLLARSDAHKVLIFGAGVQARTQLAALGAVRPLTAMRVYDPNSAAAQALVREYASPELDCLVAEDADEWVSWADVIIAATTSRTPVFDGSLVRPGTHVTGIGSYTPQMQELDPTLIVRADRVVCDTKEGALAEAGDLTKPLAGGLITPARVDSELGQIVLGRAPGRVSEQEVTVYKGVGLAALDLVTAKRVLARAQERGLGMLVDLID